MSPVIYLCSLHLLSSSPPPPRLWPSLYLSVCLCAVLMRWICMLLKWEGGVISAPFAVTEHTEPVAMVTGILYADWPIKRTDMCLGKTDDLSKSRFEDEQSRRHCFIVSACVRVGEIDLSGGSRLLIEAHSNKNGKKWQKKRRKNVLVSNSGEPVHWSELTDPLQVFQVLH